MKNIENKEKEANDKEIIMNTDRKYSSPKKDDYNLKIRKNIQCKKFCKTIKKEKHDLLKIIDIKKVAEKKSKQNQVLLFNKKDKERGKIINKNENPIIISTSQNYTPNKRKFIKFRLSETQSKRKEKWIPVGKLNLNETENYKNNYLTKRNRLVYQSNNKSNKTSNINSLILNFKKDIPSNEHRIQSVNSKKSNNQIENNSYIIKQKRNILNGQNFEINKKRNIINNKNKEFNYNYTIKIAKNKNILIKKKRKDNILLDNEINKKYFKSYIINKYSNSFVNNHMKIIEELKKSNEKKINREKKIKYNNYTIQKKIINKNLIKSKIKSSLNIKENKKSNVSKKKSLSSLTTNKRTRKAKNFLDKNNVHQMTEFSESFNNDSIPITINKIKFNLSKKFQNITDRDIFTKEKEEKDDLEILKEIKKNINVKKSKDKNNKNKNEKQSKYPRIQSHKILITNININLYKNINDTKKKDENDNENINDNLHINSDETRTNNINLKLNLDESIIDLEKIYLLEEKIRKILLKINNYEICDEECQNFITFYFSINFYKKELELFEKNKNKKKISNYMKLEILCYLLCYDISLNENFNQASILLKTIINLLHDNYLVLMSYILYLYNNKNYENSPADVLWLNKIEKIIFKELKINLTSQDMNENSILSIIINTNKTIINYYKMIIENLYFLNSSDLNDLSDSVEENLLNLKNTFPNCLQLDLNTININEKTKIISNFFTQANKSLNNYSYENMKLFFYIFLNNPKYNSDRNSSKNNNIYTNTNTNTNISQYYLPPIKPNYKYSLLINLDETLIYNDNGKIILRPNLHNFLNMVKELYELIVFSFESNTFVDKVIEIIEQKNKYFDYILYANQFTLNNNGKLVKDLESLGRNIKNIIVIDSKFHLDKKYKNNFILIKRFSGNDMVDINLLKILGYILQTIKIENYKDDIRISINKHKKSIKTYLLNNS